MDINDKEKQIEELVEKMTTEEKVAQTLQLSYQSMSAEKFEETVQKGVLGSYLHVLGKDTEKYINAAKNSRLGILPMFGIDAIHGHALLRGAACPSVYVRRNAYGRNRACDGGRSCRRRAGLGVFARALHRQRFALGQSG